MGTESIDDLQSSFDLNTLPADVVDIRNSPEPASVTTRTINKISVGKKFAAVTANTHATQAAENILTKGGSAIDAAIAAQMVLGLVEPQSSGLGGGGFLLYWDAKNKKLQSYDGRETAPSKATEHLFLNNENKSLSIFDAIIGGRSVGVPGMVRMLELAYDQHGQLPWGVLFEDAIALASEGFEVSNRLHTLITKVPKVDARPDMANYLFSNSKPLAQGRRLKNPEYASTLKRLSKEGADVFYEGSIAKEIVDVASGDSNAGLISLFDLESYQALYREPICKVVFNYRFCGMGPPSSGGTTVLSILSLMEKLRTEEVFATNESIGRDVAVTHAFIEASRLAFADRYTYLADPSFVDVPVTGLMEEHYVKQRATLINMDRRAPVVDAGIPSGLVANTFLTHAGMSLPSTTHLSIVDADGNIVSMTSSIESAFGSRLMAGGFILNNQLTDFSFSPVTHDNKKIANRVQGGKRPVSSMSPMIVFDQNDQPVMAIGSPGGRSIIPYVARVLYETLALGRSLAEVVAEKHVVDTGKLRLEKGFNPVLAESLKVKGHQPEFRDQTSGIHAIQMTDNGWLVVADPRREGSVAAQ